jgi:hypothetical protein
VNVISEATVDSNGIAEVEERSTQDLIVVENEMQEEEGSIVEDSID